MFTAPSIGRMPITLLSGTVLDSDWPVEPLSKRKNKELVKEPKMEEDVLDCSYLSLLFHGKNNVDCRLIMN